MTTHLITRGAPPVLAARKPTGLPTWPMLLLAGGQKCGKTYTAVELSASDLVDRTFVIEVGEGAVDQYGAIPGARFEILEHDGTFQGIARQVWAATLVPRGPSGKPNAIVLDSATEVWDLVSGEQQELANQRRERKLAERGGRAPEGAEDAPITMDQWNAAKKRWRALVDLLRSHDGPVIWTARFEEVAKMGENGQPIAGKKEWKIRTEKNLPYEVDGIVEIPAPREFYVTGIRSLRFVLDPGEKRQVPGFSLDAMLRALGLEDEVGQRHYVAPNTEAYLAEHAAEQAEAVTRAGQPNQQTRQQPASVATRTAKQWIEAIDALDSYEGARELYRQCSAAGQLELDHEGLGIGARIQGKGEQLRELEKQKAQSVMAGPRQQPSQPAAAGPAAVEPAPSDPEPAAGAPASSEPVAETDQELASRQAQAEHDQVDVDNAAEAASQEQQIEQQPDELREADPIQSRRESARRKGTLAALREEFGNDEVLEAACIQVHQQTVENVATQKLGDWLQSVIRERNTVGASS